MTVSNIAGRSIEQIRADFPLINGSRLAYLDNSATTQKPACVLGAAQEYYEHYNANPFRGLYELAGEATDRYEAARMSVKRFIGAASTREIIFTRNASESLNLAAFCLGEAFLSEGDEIVVSIMEHHSNILPWQQAAKRTGAVLKYVECDEQGSITADMVNAVLTERTKIVSLTHVSNVLGVKNDIKTIAGLCHSKGVIVVCDGAQSVPHMPVDVSDLGVDLLAFSGHKMLAPMGIGVLYGREELLDEMPPFLTGGEMIESVSRYSAKFAELPHKFEAGTVNAGGAIALAAAIDYIEDLGFDYIQAREEKLTKLCFERLSSIPHVSILGSQEASGHHGIVTFLIDGVHPHDVAAILDSDNIAVRAGHHCAQPLHQFLGIPASTRASIAFYNTEEEIERLAESVGSIRRRMGYGE